MEAKRGDLAVVAVANSGPYKAFVILGLWGGLLLPAGLFLLVAVVLEVVALYVSRNQLR